MHLFCNLWSQTYRMTLITHIWNGNQTILAGDGRIKENGKIICDNLQKVFVNEKQKFGIGLHGTWPTMDGYNSYLHLNNLVKEKPLNYSLIKFSNNIQQSFAEAGQNIAAKIQIGGFDDKGQQSYSVPLFSEKIIDRIKENKKIGFITSNKDDEHGKVLHKIFLGAFENTFGLLSDEEKENLDETKLVSFLSDFYESAHKSSIANPDKSNGNNIDIYLITPKKVTCLRNDNELRFDFTD